MESPLGVTLGTRMSAYLNTADDFNKQRKRLNKQLRRVRRDLGIITSDTKHYKEKNHDSEINEESYAQNKEYGLLLLLTAERDMLHALEIKALLEIGNERAHSYKNLMVSKMKKAMLICKRLLSIIQEENEKLVVIETYIYASLVQGAFSINRKQWKKALNAFSIAKCALDFLSAQTNSQLESKESENTLFKKTLLDEVAELVIDPSLSLALSQSNQKEFSSSDLKTASRRHCHDHELEYLKPVIDLIGTIDNSFVSDITASIDLIKNVEWRGHTASLYNEELALKIMQLNEMAKDHTFTESNDLEEFISRWSEVLDIHVQDIEMNKDEDDLEKVQHRAILLTYINYNLLFTRIKRDSLLIQELLTGEHNQSTDRTLETYKDIYRLYDAIISTISELADLPGVHNEEELSTSLASLKNFYATKKTFILAEAFSLAHKFAESLKLFVHIVNIVEQNVHYEIEAFPYGVSSNEEVIEFSKLANRRLSRARMCTQFSVELSPSTAIQLTWIENVNSFGDQGEKGVIKFLDSPSLTAVCSKPVLFDIGFNYIKYGQGLQTSSSQYKTEKSESQQKKGAFFGIFGRS